MRVIGLVLDFLVVLGSRDDPGKPSTEDSIMRQKKTKMSRHFAVTAILIAGCASAPQPVPETPEAPPPQQPLPASTSVPDAGGVEAEAGAESNVANAHAAARPAGSPSEEMMRSHFKETELIRKAVIEGNLSAAVAPAKALAHVEGLEELGKNWRVAVESLQEASSRIGSSPDMTGAATATADIGRACGVCHRVGAGPKANVGSPPEAGTTLDSRMKRHVWATERLWEGLYVPSDAAWNAGASALAGDTFPAPILKKGGVHARSAAERFQKTAAKSASLKKAEERAQNYATLLETCSACHQATRSK